MMKQQILSSLSPDYPWADRLLYFQELPSTNDYAKALANQGAPEGTVIIAQKQTAGHGRLGRSFYAPAGAGVYLSILLRPDRPPEQMLHLTCAAAVAMCQAVERFSNVRPQIKWTNDLVMENRKLGGILTELSINRNTGNVDWVVVGIGINCTQSAEDFPPELQDIATSIQQVTGQPADPGILAAQMMNQLYQMRISLFSEKNRIMEAYRTNCMTVGKEIVLMRGETKRYGSALGIDESGGLMVQFKDGSKELVQSGEVSVRGLYGYV